MIDNTTGFAKTSKSKADFLDFIASTYYAQNCAHCRSVQGIALIALQVGMFATSAGVVAAIISIASGAGVMGIIISYFGGLFGGSVLNVAAWLVYFSLWKGVTDKIADSAPEIPTGIVTVTEDDFDVIPTTASMYKNSSEIPE